MAFLASASNLLLRRSRRLAHVPQPIAAGASACSSSLLPVRSGDSREPWGPMRSSQQRCIGTSNVVGTAPPRVRINRFTGVNAQKISAPKTEWQIAAEREFLAMRDAVPEGYIKGLTADDVRQLSPEMQACLSLKCANSEEISRFRKQELVRKFQRRPFDHCSPAVRIAILTEKILRLRAHMLRDSFHQYVRRTMSMLLAKRTTVMKKLYKSDFMLYKHVCKELGIRFVRFAVPENKDPSRRMAPMAIDGDKARFLIRQRLWHAKFRPRELREPETNRRIRYTRHPMEPVPATHGQPQPTMQQVSRAWPYGVREDRVAGKHVVYNPCMPGPGFKQALGRVPGGNTPR
eukprot:TRINITY_DN115228_c0_g1_i1.p2 TRINITY_DN115228_c0_g1~~TRINITY_DN115228_c0_g1_i1.p2  ORF type:complete len:347 (+),score=57.24 TRINITY_DN115228_c0_g1_i1:119-1159(+)